MQLVNKLLWLFHLRNVFRNTPTHCCLNVPSVGTQSERRKLALPYELVLWWLAAEVGVMKEEKDLQCLKPEASLQNSTYQIVKSEAEVSVFTNASFKKGSSFLLGICLILQHIKLYMYRSFFLFWWELNKIDFFLSELLFSQGTNQVK